MGISSLFPMTTLIYSAALGNYLHAPRSVLVSVYPYIKDPLMSCVNQMPNLSCLMPPKTFWCFQSICECVRNDRGFAEDQQEVTIRPIWVSQMELSPISKHGESSNPLLVAPELFLLPCWMLSIGEGITKCLIPSFENFACSPQTEGSLPGVVIIKISVEILSSTPKF